jgi:hypothetical protein
MQCDNMVQIFRPTASIMQFPDEHRDEITFWKISTNCCSALRLKHIQRIWFMTWNSNTIQWIWGTPYIHMYYGYWSLHYTIQFVTINVKRKCPLITFWPTHHFCDIYDWSSPYDTDIIKLLFLTFFTKILHWSKYSHYFLFKIFIHV